jgi:hypothetical protein
MLIAAGAGLGFGLFSGYHLSKAAGTELPGTMIASGALFAGVGLAIGYAMP